MDREFSMEGFNKVSSSNCPLVLPCLLLSSGRSKCPRRAAGFSLKVTAEEWNLVPSLTKDWQEAILKVDAK